MIDNIAFTSPRRLGLWLCFGMYLAAFALPVRFHEAYVPGISLFLLGALGFVLSVYGLLYSLFQGPTWDIIHFVVATLPWLANIIFWFALALYAQGHSRASLRAGVFAALLAAVVLISSNPLSGDFYKPRTEFVLVQLLSPAYLAWAGSMALLVVLAGSLAWRQKRRAALWYPTADWLAANERDTLEDLSRRLASKRHPTSEAVVADHQSDREKPDAAVN
jgi:hypothetical protein